jgi:hypothetical protein
LNPRTLGSMASTLTVTSANWQMNSHCAVVSNIFTVDLTAGLVVRKITPKLKSAHCGTSRGGDSSVRTNSFTNSGIAFSVLG